MIALKSLLNSNRSGHLFAAAVTALAIFPFHPITAVSVFLWELFATCDMDLAENRRPKRLPSKLWVGFWYPWGKLVKHRSFLSHSLLIGTPLRLVYVLAIPVVLLLNPHSVLHWAWEGHRALVLTGLETVVVSAFVGDAVHLIKDDYGVKELLLGSLQMKIKLTIECVLINPAAQEELEQSFPQHKGDCNALAKAYVDREFGEDQVLTLALNSEFHELVKVDGE